MKKSVSIPFLIAVLGFFGASIRASELKYGFEAGTGLPVPGNAPAFWLIVFSAVVLVVCLLISVISVKYKSAQDFLNLTGVKSGGAAARMISAFFLLISGVFLLMRFLSDSSPSTAVSAILSIFAAFCIMGVTSAQKKGKQSAEHAFFSLVPVFWACFNLIALFRVSSPNPVVSQYVYSLFALIFVMLSLYTYSAFFYKKPLPRFSVLMSLAGIYFLITAYAGAIIHIVRDLGIKLLLGFIPEYGVFLAMLIYLFSNVVTAIQNTEDAALYNLDDEA